MIFQNCCKDLSQKWECVMNLQSDLCFVNLVCGKSMTLVDHALMPERMFSKRSLRWRSRAPSATRRRTLPSFGRCGRGALLRVSGKSSSSNSMLSWCPPHAHERHALPMVRRGVLTALAYHRDRVRCMPCYDCIEMSRTRILEGKNALPRIGAEWFIRMVGLSETGAM